MNYGYAQLSDDGIYLKDESLKENPWVHSIQLYDFSVVSVAGIKEQKNLSLLEVGSGRGGGLFYLQQQMNPATAIGVDLSA